MGPVPFHVKSWRPTKVWAVLWPVPFHTRPCWQSETDAAFIPGEKGDVSMAFHMVTRPSIGCCCSPDEEFCLFGYITWARTGVESYKGATGFNFAKLCMHGKA